MPDTAAERKKWFLKKGGGAAEKLVWEQGRVFHFDFFNPYLDFNSKKKNFFTFFPLATVVVVGQCPRVWEYGLTHGRGGGQILRSSCLVSRCRCCHTWVGRIISGSRIPPSVFGS